MPDPTANSRETELRWLLEDTSVLYRACDQVFGIITVLLALGSVVCWFLGEVSAHTAVLLLVFPIENLALSKLGDGGRRLRYEAIRVVFNVPYAGVIYALSDGLMQGLWLLLLVMVAGGALTWPMLMRRVGYGRAITLLYVASLAIAATQMPHLEPVRAVWHGLALIIVGFVLSTITAQLGGSLIATRRRHAEAERCQAEMRLVLDNVAQGFITVDLDGVMASERSAIVDRWLGTPAPGATFGELIGSHAPEAAAWFALGMDSVREGLLPLDLCLEQLPQRFVARGRTLANQYTPILRDDRLEQILVIVNDVTDQLERARDERDQRELLAQLERVVEDRAGFDEFLDEAGSLVASLATPGDPIVELRSLHTLKGSCAIYGFESYAEICHTIEGELAETRAPLADIHRTALAGGWAKLTAQMTRLLGERARCIEIDHGELAAIVDQAKRGAASRELASTLADWSHERVVRRFERLGRYATHLARRLGKGELDLAIAADGIRLDHGQWSAFWAALVHAIRNAVDHGLDTPDDRLEAGKPARPRMTLAATRSAGYLTISVADDGRGIDWDRVRERAAAAGLPAASRADLEEALFRDGFSTRRDASAVSGRGVGMAALRSAVDALGGEIEIESNPGLGTTLHFRFVDGEPHARALAS